MSTKRIRHSIDRAKYLKLITHVKSDVDLKEHNRIKLLRIFGVLYYTGIRLNEIHHINIGKLRELIAEQGGVIYTSKKDKERKLFFSDTACKELTKLIKHETNPLAQIASSWNKQTTAMHPISLINSVNKYMQKVLGAGHTSHSFRQGILSEMFESHVDTGTCRDFIGHADATTTLKYKVSTDNHIRSSLVR